MIDRRNISYTQGDPLTPVVDGTLLQTAPTLDVPTGTVISRSTRSGTYVYTDDGGKVDGVDLPPDTPPPPLDPDPKQGSWVDIMGLLGVGGMWDFYWNASAYGGKQGIKTLITNLGAAQGKDPNEVAKLFESEEWENWEPQSPLIPTINIDPPTIPEFKWPDLSGLGKTAIIIGAALGGIYIIGKYLGRKRA